MKKTISMLFVFAFLAASQSFAQRQQMNVEQRIKMSMDQLKPLNLSQDQQTKTQAVYTQFYENMQKNMQDARQSGQRPDRSVFQKSMQDRDAALKGIFTDAQYKTYKDKIEKNMMQMRNNPNRGQGNRMNPGNDGN